MARTISWIHLSDLHSGRPDAWDWHDVSRAALADIRAMCGRLDISPDFLFFTGDLVWGRDPRARPTSILEQYEQAAAFLREVRAACSPTIPAERVFMVPGNHDVDRSEVSEAIQSLLNHMTLETLETWLKKRADPDWKTLRARLGQYDRFVRGGEYAHLATDAVLATYTRTLNCNGASVVVAGWNSAWSSGSNSERGRLWLGYRTQIEPAFQELRDKELSILLMHHPPGWFRSEESELVARVIEQRFDFFLHGHEHDPWIRSFASGHSTLAASAIYDAGSEMNGYNLVRLDLDRRTGDAWFRQYVRRSATGRFEPITAIPDADELGRVSLRLRQGDPIRSGSKSPQPSVDVPEAPDDFFTLSRVSTQEFQLVGRAAELKEAQDKLTSARTLLIAGPPGQGKSAFARALARTLSSQYSDGAWVISVHNEKRLEPVIRQIAAICRRGANARLSRIIHGRSVLIILDGFESLCGAIADIDVLREFFNEISLDPLGTARIIVTSQVTFEKFGVAMMNLPGLDRLAAVELFQRAAKWDEGGYAELGLEVEKFVMETLDGHPLSINIVGSYGAALALSFSELRREYQDMWSEIARHRPSLDDSTLSASFGISYESLQEEHKALFLVCGLLPDGLAANEIHEIWPREGARSVRQVLATLRDRSLLQFDGRVFRTMQPLRRYAEREFQTEAAKETSWVGSRAGILASALNAYHDRFVRVNAPQSGDRDTVTKSRLIRDHFLNIHSSIDRRFATPATRESLAAAGSVLTLYWAYHNNLTGRNSTIPIDDSVAYLRMAQRVFESHASKTQALQCKFFVGHLTWLRGDLPVARTYLREVLDDTELTSAMRLECERAFAHMEYSTGNICHAVELFERAAASADGEKLLEIATQCRLGLLDAHRKLENFEAVRHLSAELTPVLSSLPAALRGNVIRGVAYAELAAGNLDEAERLYIKALGALTEVSAFGEAHCRRGLGDVYTRLGRFDEATESFDWAQRLYTEAVKQRSLGVALVRVGRGLLAARRRDTASAVCLLREAIAMLDTAQLNERFDQSRAFELLGDVYVEAGQTADAVGVYRLAIVGYHYTGCDAAERRVTGKVSNQRPGGTNDEG